jgi:hypothetical protein
VPRNRAALAQAFEENANGQAFIVSINHLKSKGCADSSGLNADQGDGQGCWNPVRVNAALELVSWLMSDPTGTGDTDILLIGDYNSYAMEDPITVFEETGFTHLIKSFLGPDAYSYVFDGQWGSLDHALVSPSMTSQVTGVADYHINADEPSVLDYNTNFKSAGQISSLYAPDEFRVSDHDPVIVGVCMPPTLNVTVTPGVLWSPNNKYVTVQASFDATSDVVSIDLLSITSNEPDDTIGNENFTNDIVIIDNTTFNLRAERMGTGTGRIYTVTYTATNGCGATTTATATVTVPLNPGN